MQQVDFKDIVFQKWVRNAHLNIGTGQWSVSKTWQISSRSTLVSRGVCFFREDKPDGTMKKLTGKTTDLGWEYCNFRSGSKDVWVVCYSFS
jgi:GDP-L-fucose synthase